MGEQDQPRDNRGRWTHGLVDSLEQQLRAKGHDAATAHAKAVEILQTQGSVDKDGNLTAQGEQRQALGREGRAVGRMARQTGHPEHQMVYDPKARRAFVK